MDDTIVDYLGALARDYEAIKHPDEPPFQNVFRGERWFENRRHMITNQPGWWLNLEPLPLGEEIYRLLRKHGYQVVILTKGSEGKASCWSEKHQWCRRWLDKDVEVVVTSNKGYMAGQLLVDDWPGYFEPWLKTNPDGFVICPQHLYNRDYVNPRVTFATPDNLDQIEMLIKKNR
jgi:hypothetical protein